MNNILMLALIAVLVLGLLALYIIFPGNMITTNYFELPILMSIALFLLVFARFRKLILEMIKSNLAKE